MPLSEALPSIAIAPEAFTPRASTGPVMERLLSGVPRPTPAPKLVPADEVVDRDWAPSTPPSKIIAPLPVLIVVVPVRVVAPKTLNESFDVVIAPFKLTVPVSVMSPPAEMPLALMVAAVRFEAPLVVTVCAALALPALTVRLFKAELLPTAPTNEVLALFDVLSEWAPFTVPPNVITPVPAVTDVSPPNVTAPPAEKSPPPVV